MSIHIPLDILFDMTNNGIDSLHKDGADVDLGGPALITGVTCGCRSEEDILSGAAALPRVGEDGIAEEEEEEEAAGAVVSKEELNLTCYNLMIDVIHSQMDTQDIERHVGLNGPHANDVLAMINKMLCTPWMQAINKCLVDTIDCEDLEEDEEAGIRDAIECSREISPH